MVAIAGFTTELLYSFDGGTTYSLPDHLVDFGIDGPIEEIEVTAHGPAHRQRTYIAGHTESTINANFVVDTTDAVQTALRNIWLNGGTFKVRWNFEQGTGKPQFDGDVTLTNHTYGMNREGEATLDTTMRLTSAWVESAQP